MSILQIAQYQKDKCNDFTYLNIGHTYSQFMEAIDVLTEALENIKHLHYDTDKMYQQFSEEALEKVWGNDV